MRIALGQFNAVVGDLGGNCARMREIYSEAVKNDADVVVFPEMALCGYPPEDLLYKNHFLGDCLSSLEGLAESCGEKTIITGFAESCQGDIYNSAAVLQKGRIVKVYRKVKLANYGVFDEQRYFKAGSEPVTANVGGLNIALTICEDIWDIEWLGEFFDSAEPIQMVLNISASPFHVGKTARREQKLSLCAKKFNCAVSYCNLTGGQDELVFDGRSMLVDSDGKICASAAAFKEDLLISDVEASDEKIRFQPVSPTEIHGLDELEEIYQALVLGTRDYARKNGFEKVLLGLSGGIDSSLVAAIAAAALGPENVVGVTMPSRFNSAETITDAGRVAENLGIEFLTIPIEPVLERFDESLQAVAGWDSRGTAYENLQARIRGSILMSLSNQFGYLVLTSGNKSETAVGYTTLYGDTAGGFAVIKDVPKTIVYQLARYINKINNKEVIPAEVIARPPSAELSAGQKDSDSLPDYELLDEILKGYVEEDKSARQLTSAGLDAETVRRVIRMVDRNEYKRRQSPPGVKITPKAFGKDRRLPITNRYSSFDTR